MSVLEKSVRCKCGRNLTYPKETTDTAVVCRCGRLHFRQSSISSTEQPDIGEFTQSVAKQTFRYLKRGVFPPSGIEYLTVGRMKELSLVSNALEDIANGEGGYLFLEGLYGSGKSHMLKAIESVALKTNFAVARVHFDGYTHAFNHPPRYLHCLFESLIAPKYSQIGLSELVAYWLTVSERDKLLKWARNSDPWELGWQIRGLAGEWYGNYDHRTYYKSKIDCRDIQHKNGNHHLLCDKLRTRQKLCQAVDISGIVLLFDEVESIATLLANIICRLLSYEILDELTTTKRLPYCYFVFAVTPDLSKKIHDDDWQYQYYKQQYPNGCRFASKWMNDHFTRLEIKKISKIDNIQLCLRLRKLHEFAYSWSATERISDSFIESFIDEADRHSLLQRDIIKSFVNILEICQQNPSCHPDKELGLY